jgi:hypothetical protein
MLLSKLTRCLALALVAVTLALGGGRAGAADPIVREGIPGNEVQQHFNDFVGNGYMPTYVKGYVVDGKTYFDFVWQPKDNSRWELRNMIPDSDWQQKDSDMRTLGYVLVSSNHYVVNGQKYHATLWRKPN